MNDQLIAMLNARIELFNARRKYEWKALIGTISFLYAMGAIAFSTRINIHTCFDFAIWRTIILLSSLSCAIYEWVSVQLLNKTDRQEINDILDRLRNGTNLPTREFPPSRGYLVFIWQLIFMTSAIIFAWMAPYWPNLMK
jgi:hypothetical protein